MAEPVLDEGCALETHVSLSTVIIFVAWVESDLAPDPLETAKSFPFLTRCFSHQAGSVQKAGLCKGGQESLSTCLLMTVSSKLKCCIMGCFSILFNCLWEKQKQKQHLKKVMFCFALGAPNFAFIRSGVHLV